MTNEVIDKFLRETGPIFFVTPTVGRAIGLETILPNFHIVCAQNSASVKLLQQNGVKVFCLKKNVKNSGKLLGESEVLDYIKNNSAGERANIITFKPSSMIEKICEKNNFRYLGNDSKINREWEDKIKFAEITSGLGVPNANSRIIKIEENCDLNFLDFSEGKKYVVQFSRGYSGNSSFLADNRNELENIFENNLGRKVKIADYKEGNTYTFDVCIGEFGVLISQPIFQITGFAEFNKNLLGTCGNDYSYGKTLDQEAKKKLDLAINKVSAKLAEVGYRGILGFDFIVDDEEINLIEVNPRLVGSIPVFTKLQISMNETPFLLLHVLSFFGFNFQDVKIINERQVPDFSQLILRNVSSHPVKIIKTMLSGIYKLSNGKILFEREAYAADGVLAQDEFFLECASKGEMVDPDMEYANIQFPYGIMRTKDTFVEKFLEIKQEVLNQIILE